ncbi:MAG: hypothetical protein AB2L24_24975 [Mangrovibacterium sp.]
MFWGIFPIEASISWESHLWGAASGLILSLYYKNQGPQRTRYEWEDEQDDDLSGPADNEEETPANRS